MLFDKPKVFYGKHKEYVHYLCMDRGTPRDDGINLFERVLDLYIISPLIGILYNCKGKADYSSSDKSTIQLEQISNEREKLKLVYRVVMLLADKDTLSYEERLDRAFRYTEKSHPEEFKKNMDLFNAYSLGGIERLYEMFSNDKDDREELLQHLEELLFPDMDEIEEEF